MQRPRENDKVIGQMRIEEIVLDIDRDAVGMNEECAGGRICGLYRRYGSAWMGVGELGKRRIGLQVGGGFA